MIATARAAFGRIVHIGGDVSNRIIAIDAGYANAGVVVMERINGRWECVESAYIHTESSNKKLGFRVADDNARRIADVTRSIVHLIRTHEIKMMVAELPSTGGQSANAVRGMAYASAMLATIAECFDMAVEWYSPGETRTAGGVPRSIKKRDNVKKIVMETMGKRYEFLEKRYPALSKREHVADALATFEAARNGNLARMIE